MNYWNLDINSLPSRGRYYNPKARIEIKPLTVGDVKFLTTMNPGNAEEMLDRVLENCLKLTDLEYLNILRADRTYLLFWVRVNSFIASNGYDIEITCPVCGEKISKRVKLENLDVKYIEDTFANSIEFTDEEGEVHNIDFVMPTIRDGYRTIPEDQEIERIVNYTDILRYIPHSCDPVFYINHIDAMSYAKLINMVNNSLYGIKSEVALYCNKCNNPVHIELDLSDSNILGNMNLYEILQTQLQISKYTHFQIPDDMPYTEVEIMLEVVKEMLKKEEEEREKAKQGKSFASFR